MDLNYPSEKMKNFTNQLNKIDPRYGSIIMSNPRISVPSKTVPPKLKKKCLDFISKDDSTSLIGLMNQQAISLCDEISKQGHGWTILHYVAKTNALKCMGFCLRWLYQSQPNNYQLIVNHKNYEGDTPLLIACQNKSNAVVKTLLQYGGADIYAINSKKLTAYQIALSSFNQECLQMLMKYELKIKRRHSLNKKALAEPIPEPKTRTIYNFYICLFDCFYFGKNQIQSHSPIRDTETDRKMMKKQQNINEVLQSMPNIEIFWSEAHKIYGKKLPLFSAVSHPFSIKQSSIIVSNLMIVFQVLAEHPQLLKRIIYNTDQKFYVKLQQNGSQTLICVDNFFPFFQQRKQPLFLSLEDQIWPMVLQKALCQHYNGFFEPAKIDVEKLLQTIIGHQVYCLNFTNTENKDIHEQFIKNKLQKIQHKNGILVLKPRTDCPLKAEQGRIECFSLLKMTGQNFLINCPFIVNDEQKRESKETREMKLHRAHYHNPNCTAVWLEKTEFFSYFESAIFCNILGSHAIRHNSIKVSATSNRIYLILKIKQRLQNNTIYLSFKDQNQGKAWTPSKCMGWNMRGFQRQVVQKVDCEIIGHIEIIEDLSPSEILIACEFEEKIEPMSKKILTAICKGEILVDIQVLDSAIGDLQFIQCCKKYFNQEHHMFSAPIVQTVGDYLLVMAASQQTCFIPFPETLTEDNIVEGTLIKDENKLEMFKYSNIYFAVLSNVDYEIAKNLQIMSYEQTPEGNSIDMASGTSTN